MSFSRIKNRFIAKITTRYLSLSRILINLYRPLESDDIPWSPVLKPLGESKIAIVTTAGVHHKDQVPFDMDDSNGDPTFRVLDSSRHLSDFMITHDYYDHTDADKDINIVFPIERLHEFEKKGIIGKVADNHYGFMGHIDNDYIHSLITYSAPNVAKRLINDNIDIVLLIPG